MATKVKETCNYTDSRLVPYEGKNEFKIGTSMCSGCGSRVDSETGEPIEGVQCPVVVRQQVGINAETSQDMIAQMQMTVDQKVEEAVKAEKIAIADQHAAELETARGEVETTKAEAIAALEAQKAEHVKELKAQQEQFEETLKEINTKHANELKEAVAKATPPKQ